MTPRTRSRLILLLLVALFAAPVVAAIVLHAIGWEPSETRNNGELIQPPVDLRDLALERSDGSSYDWEPQARRWRVVVVPTPDCVAACVTLLEGLDKVWQLQGRRADRLDVLWFGTPPPNAVTFRRLVVMQPDAQLQARLTRAELGAGATPTVYLVDPSGFLALRYAPGFDVAGLRADVSQLLK